MIVAISSIIVFIYSILLLWNYHKAVLCFAPIYVIFQDYLCLRYSSPAVSLSFALEFLFILFAFLNHKIKWEGFPLKIPFFLLFFIFILGIFVGGSEFIKTAPYVIDLISSYFIVLLFYNELISKKDLRIAIKSFLLTGLILLVYGLFEFIIQGNPLIDYFYAAIPDSWNGTLYVNSGDERFGSIRCQSIMSICISWGALCCIIMSVLLYTKLILKEKISNITFGILIILILICIYSSGSRSAYIYVATLFAGAFISFQGNNKVVFVLIVIIGCIFAKEFLFNIFDSFSSTDTGGSSSGQRQMQLLVAMRVISESPLFGLGPKGVLLGQEMDGEVLGAESIWLQDLLSYGFVGIFVQIYLYYTCVKVLRQRTPQQYRPLAVCTVLGWVAFSSVSSSPGLSEPYFLMILVLLIKISDIRLSNEYKTKETIQRLGNYSGIRS